MELAPGVRIDRILSYKQLVEHIKKEDIGVLQPLPEVPGTPTVKGLCRPLKSLVTVMADLFLNNKRMASTLKWFDEPYTFHYAIGGDGAPYGRGDTTLTIWCVSFLNRGRHIGSPQDNFLLAVAACDESHPAMIRYAQCLQDEVKALDDVVEVAGHPCKFVCGLLPVDMKFLATYAGELPNSATFFSSFANVCAKTKWAEGGTFAITGRTQDGQLSTWRPWGLCFVNK